MAEMTVDLPLVPVFEQVPQIPDLLPKDSRADKRDATVHKATDASVGCPHSHYREDHRVIGVSLDCDQLVGDPARFVSDL